MFLHVFYLFLVTLYIGCLNTYASSLLLFVKLFVCFYSDFREWSLSLLHSERPKLCAILAFLSAIGLNAFNPERLPKPG